PPAKCTVPGAAKKKPRHLPRRTPGCPRAGTTPARKPHDTAGLLLHDLAGLAARGAQCRHGRLIACKRLHDLLMEHLADLGVVSDLEAARSRTRAGIRCHQLRSEEHTSELQSREKLVCRLL